MFIYFVEIDISKYKHDYCIIAVADQSVVAKFTLKNNKEGFDQLLTNINSLSSPENIIYLKNLLLSNSLSFHKKSFHGETIF